MVIINEEEIIEIAADLLGRFHRSEDVKLFSSGEWREYIRQHIRLNFCRKLKFCPDTLFLSSNFCNVLNICLCFG